jgi:AcrR family transcriptional regulator
MARAMAGPSPPPEQPSHDRILRAGRSLFALQGYENTTTAAIARDAGTSESQLIKHFGSKEGLLEAIFDQGWLRIDAAVLQIREQTDPPSARLRAVTELLISGLEQDAEMRSLMLLEGRRIRKHGRMVVLTRGYTRMVAVIDGLLEEMRQSGELRPELHVQAVRSALVGACEGLLRDQLLAERVGYPASYDGLQLRAAVAAALEGFLTRRSAG